MIKMNTYTSPVHIHRKETSWNEKKNDSLYLLVWNDNKKPMVSLVISMIVHPVRCIRYTVQCIQGNIRSLLKCLSGHPWYKTKWLLVAKSKSMGIISPYASVTTRRTCYGSCVSGAAAELRLKFCVSCDWLGSESDFAATAPATHVSCGRRASDALNRTQNIPQRRHVQGTGAVPSQYLQQAFAVPPATCPYGGVRVCTSVARRWCVEGTTHVHRTHGHILPAQRIYSELITGIPEKFLTLLNTVKTHQLTWQGTPGEIFFWTKYISKSPLKFFQ